MSRWLEGIWYGSASGWFLRPLSALFAVAQRLRAAAYRTGVRRAVRIGRPVIVIGNLTVGGTGKTPLVAWLTAALASRGVRVGIVSRGYGRAGSGVRTVEPDASWEEVGDEPLLLARRTGAPVVVGRDRVAAARRLVSLGVEVIVADDGLQHLRLARDVEVAVVDATRRLGNARLLPAGPLREPAWRLSRMHAIVLNGAASGAAHGLPAGETPVLDMQLVADGVLPVGTQGPAEPLSSYRGRAVHAVAGIGNPARFFSLLREHGVSAVEHPFPDHHAFTPGDLAFADALPVLMTEKDAVKCSRFDDPRLRYVRVTAQLGEADARRLLALALRRPMTT